VVPSAFVRPCRTAASIYGRELDPVASMTSLKGWVRCRLGAVVRHPDRLDLRPARCDLAAPAEALVRAPAGDDAAGSAVAPHADAVGVVAAERRLGAPPLLVQPAVPRLGLARRLLGLTRSSSFCPLAERAGARSPSRCSNQPGSREDVAVPGLLLLPQASRDDYAGGVFDVGSGAGFVFLIVLRAA
jgi:hypothetical protein